MLFENPLFIQQGTTNSKQPIATLSTSGWVQTTNEALDAAMAYAFVSYSNQSTLFYGTVTSMAEIFMQYGNTPDRLVEQLSNRLQVYLSEFFDNVTVQCTHDFNKNPGKSYGVHCFVEVIEGGVTYTAASALLLNGGKLAKYFKLNNDGTLAARR